MRVVDRHRAWDKDMDRDKFAGRGLACAQRVKVYLLLPVGIEHVLDLFLVCLGQGGVHQAGHGTTQQRNSRPDDVPCHQQGYNRVQDEPAGDGHQATPANTPTEVQTSVMR